MISIIAIALVVLAFYFSIKKPIYLVVLYALTAANDAYGILHYIQKGFGSYSFFMQLIMIFAAARLIFNYLIKTDGNLVLNHTNLQLILFFVMFFVIFLTLVARSLNMEFFFIGNFSYCVLYHTPLVLIILILSADSQELFKCLKVLAGVQTVLALLVIYFSENNAFLQSISAVQFLDFNELDTINEGKAEFGNLFKVVFDKYSLNQFAHFHNSNVTGFYGASTLFLYFYDFIINKKPIRRIVSFVFAFSGFFLWANSGMRGPIIGMIIGILFYCFFVSKHQLQKVFMIPLIPIFLIWLINSDQMSIMNEMGMTTSLASRELRRQNAMQFISDHIFFGSYGLPGTLTSINADAHELPLYLAALYGAFTGFLYLFISYVFPVAHLIRHKKSVTLLNLGCYMIVVSVSFTNCFTAPTLFWFLLALAVSFDKKDFLSKRTSEVL